MLLSYLSQPLIGDLIIRIIGNEFTSELQLGKFVLISTSTKTTVLELKRRIWGATKIPVHRILLIYYGAILSADTNLIPVDAFESTEIADEDTDIFKARLCVFVLPKTDLDKIELTVTEDVMRVITPVKEKLLKAVVPVRCKRVRKHKEPIERFNLENELVQIKCERFAAVLRKHGFDNEGAFASIAVQDMIAPGVWIPLGAAKRVVEAAVKVQQRMIDMEKKNVNVRAEVEQQLLESNRITTIAMEGVELEEGSKPFLKKVDLRRAWEKEEHRKKYGSHREDKPYDMPSKIHNESLQKKIDAIRRRIKQEESIDNDKDLVDPARILYQYQGSPKKKVISSTNIVNKVHKLVDTLRSTATTPSSDLVNNITMYYYPSEIMNNEITCCQKHNSTVSKNREQYVAQRRLINTLEIQVALKGLSSYGKGYVKSSTLEAIVREYLKAFRNAPLRNYDPSELVDRCVRSSTLELFEQQRVIRCVQRHELTIENLVTVLPVEWYNPHKFVLKLVALLDELEAERVA